LWKAHFPAPLANGAGKCAFHNLVREIPPSGNARYGAG